MLVGVVKMAKQFSTYPTKMALVPRNGVRFSSYLNMLWIKKFIALWSTSLIGKFLNLSALSISTGTKELGNQLFC